MQRSLAQTAMAYLGSVRSSRGVSSSSYGSAASTLYSAGTTKNTTKNTREQPSYGKMRGASSKTQFHAKKRYSGGRGDGGGTAGAVRKPLTSRDVFL